MEVQKVRQVRKSEVEVGPGPSLDGQTLQGRQGRDPHSREAWKHEYELFPYMCTGYSVKEAQRRQNAAPLQNRKA